MVTINKMIKAFKIKIDIKNELKKRCLQNKNRVDNRVKIKKFKCTKILSEIIGCSIEEQSQNIKLQNILCVAKESKYEVYGISNIIYNNETHYCVNIWELYEEIDEWCRVYNEKYPDDKSICNIDNIEFKNEDDILNYILNMTLQELIDICEYLILESTP